MSRLVSRHEAVCETLRSGASFVLSLSMLAIEFRRRALPAVIS